MDETKGSTWRRPGGRMLALVLLALALGLVLGRCTVSGPESGSPPAAGERSGSFGCSMHPQVQAPAAGLCPLCGMDLVPMGAPRTNSGGLRLSAFDRERAGIAIEAARREPLEIILELPGILEVDETATFEWTARLGGRLEEVFVAGIGDHIEAGQDLCSIVSADLLQAQADFLLAFPPPGSESPAVAFADARLVVARRRLALLGMSAAAIDELARRKSIEEATRFQSPVAGVLIEKNAIAGRAIAEGERLFVIADYTRLRLLAQAAAGELALLTPGAKLEIVCDALPGMTFMGILEAVSPILDPVSRRTTLRIAVQNPDLRLASGLLARARSRLAIDAEGRSAGAVANQPITIPVAAPLGFGDQALVWIEEKAPDGGSDFHARAVTLGPRNARRQAVLRGLSEGERVVSRGAFRIDAAAQIAGRASFAFRDVLPPLLTGSAVSLARALAADDLAASSRAALDVESALRAASPRLRAALEARLPRGQDLAALRTTFAAFSAGLVEFAGAGGHRHERTLVLAHCPMAEDGRGAEWLQEEGPIANPYFGAAMLRCGEARLRLPPAPEPGR